MTDAPPKGDPANWKHPTFVTEWPCRTCGEYVPITKDAIEAAHVWDQILTARGEQPIDRLRVMFCSACVIKHRASAIERRSHEQAEIAETVRQLKNSPHPEREHDLQLRLKSLGHSSVDELIKSLADARTVKGGPKKRHGEL